MELWVRHGGASLLFEDTGLVRMRFEPGAIVTQRDAQEVLRELDRRIPHPKPILVLADGRHSRGLSLTARLDFVDWIRRNLGRYEAAAYDVPPLMMVTASVINVAIGGRLRVCRDEAEARRWLRQRQAALRERDGGGVVPA